MRDLWQNSANIEAKVKIYDYDAPIPKEIANNYYVDGKSMPNIWGEAIHSRIRAQKDVYFQDRIFAEKFPHGSAYDPKLTGKYATINYRAT